MTTLIDKVVTTLSAKTPLLHHFSGATVHCVMADSRQTSEALLGYLGVMLGASLAMVEVGPAKVVLCS